MKSLSCEKCGASSWNTLNGYRICQYCGTKYQLTLDDIVIKKSHIAVNSDIERLLSLCKTEPYNAKKYANLILDIDPSNKEALKYL